MTLQSTKLTLRLFGAFRRHFPACDVALVVPSGATVGDLRALLLAEWAGQAEALALLDSSVFASANAILAEADVIDAAGGISLLPPVSGG